MRRTDADGNDIGAAYQAECIQSWIDSGFEPISINSLDEPQIHPVRTIRIKRDSFAKTNRKVVFLQDFLDTISQYSAGHPYVILNADICLPGNNDLYARSSAIYRGQFLISRRLENNIPYLYGYDVFVGHADDLLSVGPNELVFGLPWWDHFLPLALWAAGCKVSQIQPFATHFPHEDRWNPDLWVQFGRIFLREIKVRNADLNYLANLNKALSQNTGSALSKLLLACRKAIPRYTRQEMVHQLHRVSALNLSTLDETAIL
jgi:hypothetical protein